jgi:hypothetical protein
MWDVVVPVVDTEEMPIHWENGRDDKESHANYAQIIFLTNL